MPAIIEGGAESMVRVAEAIMASRGGLTPDARILDFGCGAGRHLREFRESGYQDVQGVDIPFDGLAAELAALPDDGRGIHVSDENGVFPFDDETFDFCFSTQVFEHVMEYDTPIRELSRVLKPGAWMVHVFPSRWRPIEPHMYTPFGGRFQGPRLMRLWAQLGIRNQHQKGCGARQTAESNLRFARMGINYLPGREIAAAFQSHFGLVGFVEREFVAATKDVSRVSNLVARVIDIPGADAAYRNFHTRAILARKI